MGNNKKKKTAATVGAVTLVAALVLTGTYAWNSISQKAKNENIVYSNPGGRLHDDWNGSDPKNGKKQVYVENFTDQMYAKDTSPDGSVKTDTNATSIYVRVKLQTYMEFGEDAGVTQKEDVPGSGNYVDMNESELGQRNVKPLVNGTTINKPEDWPVYIAGQNDAFQSYFTLETQKDTKLKYLPTFNKNKESLLADINGTYEGAKSGGTTGPFSDFVDYSTQSSPVKKDAYYYLKGGTAKANPSEAAGDETEHFKNPQEEHSVSETLETKKIITMEEWLSYDGTTVGQEKTGNYWIYDEDGWAYWADALEPGDATGPLLTDVKMKASLGGNCYYAINVTGEFASAGDWGKQGASTDKELGFYKNGITDNALTLLNTISNTVGADWVNVTAKSGSTTGSTATNTISVEPGATVDFTGDVTLMGQSVTNQEITWALNGTAARTATLTKSGKGAKLTIPSDMTAQTLKVTATPKANPNVEVTYKVKIVGPDKVTITTNDKTKNVRANAVVNFTKAVLRKNGNTYANDAVTWSVRDSKSPTGATKIDGTGKLTIGADEVEGTELTVVAASVADPSVSAETKVTVHPLAETELQKIDAVSVNEDGILDPSTGATEEITIDGKLFYVLAKKDGNALVIKKCTENQTRAFGATSEWETATLRTYLNGEYLDNNPTLKALAVSTKLKTWSKWDAANTFTNITETEDKVFCLAEADIFGTTNGQTAPADHYMLTKQENSGGSSVTVGIKLTGPNLNWGVKWEPTGNDKPNQDSGFLLRSPHTSMTLVAHCYGALDAHEVDVDSNGIRPALWISL